MFKIAKNLSPFTLGVLFCCSQATLLPSAHAASLNPTSSVDVTLPSANTVDPFVLGASAASGPTTLSSVDCPPQSGPSSTVPKNSGNTSLNYQSNEIASSNVPGPEAVAKTTQNTAMAKSPTLIAQAAAGDCCGIGGAATCEVGGVPTGGAALGGLSPLLGLLGIVPAAAAIPLALGDGDNNDPGPGAGPLEPGAVPGEPGAVPGEQPGAGPGPGLGEPGPGPGPGEPPPPAAVPEPSSTGAIVSVFGMMCLWLSRRHRSGRKDENVSLE